MAVEDRQQHPRIDERGLEAAVLAVRRLYLERLDKAVESQQLDISDFGEFFLNLKEETDRAMAVVGFTYLEANLRHLMAGAMDPSVPGGVQKLFEANGPLSTVSACLRMARALGWLSSDTYRDLDLLRRMRNDVAHSHKTIRLDDDTFGHRLAEITPHETPIARSVCFEHAVSRRTQLRCRLAGTCGRMIRELLIAPRAIRIGIGPSDAFSRPYEDIPEYLRNILRQTAKVILEILEQDMPDEFSAAMERFNEKEGDGKPAE